ncbi:MAG: uroporphyrinogen-III C-methyltransferase [bacterium]
MAKVYLIGAGPGDPGLLTLKGRDILSMADVVVYDYLAGKSLLAHCRPDAELIYVGKKGGDHTMAQQDINALLVAKAGEGKTIARLKGGDPYVFGRGAEEAEDLVAAGIEFEVVPGVTSAVAATAYAGIPLTHRDYASSVSFITGHEDPTKPDSAHNWESLAKGTSTLVFFMGVKNLPMITKELARAGMDAAKPAALVRWGTTCLQQTLVAEVGTIAQKAKEAGFKPPALLVVGDVVRLRETLGWFEKRPLLGKGVVVTRAREQASELAVLLENQGACTIEFPTISITPLDDEGAAAGVSQAGSFDWVVFTSVNGVKFFWKYLADQNLDTRILGSCNVAAIGPATADALRERGIRPDFVPHKYVAEHVVQGLLELGVKGKRVLIPRAEKAREILPEELGRAGAEVRILPVYRTGLVQQSGEELLAQLEEGTIQVITFTSSSTVENFFQLVEPEQLKPHLKQGVKLACIGPVTGKTLEGFGFTADIQSPEYTIPGLVEAIVGALKE